MQTLLSVLLFIICLSTLIMIHEAGHLSAAKIFRVYCDDYSIGFGKAFLHKKRKNGETYFSLRVVPFGGFVSIAEKEGELPSGVFVKHERTLAGIRKWKTAIIMAAGVFLNFVLALVLLFMNNAFFDVQKLYLNVMTVEQGSIAEKAGVQSTLIEKISVKGGDLILSVVDPRNNTSGKAIYYYDTEATVTLDDDSKIPVIAAVQSSSISYKKSCDFDEMFNYYGLDSELNANYEDQYTPDYVSSEGHYIKSVTLDPYFYQKNEGTAICSHCHETINNSDLIQKDNNYYCPYCDFDCNHKDYILQNGKYVDRNPMVLEVKTIEGKKKFDHIGISLSHISYRQTFSEAVETTFKEYGEGASLIFVSIGKLFIGQGWENTGGIIAVYSQSANVLSTMNFGYYLYYWGLISINLGIVNLLPFPGLDGWQLLVLAIEGITRKKIPDKAKTIMSYIGLGLLFLLMGVLIVKDIIGFF